MLCDFSTTLPQLHESVFDVEVEILAVIAFNLVRPLQNCLTRSLWLTVWWLCCLNSVS